MTVDKLQEKISLGSAVLVTGTGVSKQISGLAAGADWIGLLRNGIDHIEHMGLANSDWVALTGMQLDAAKDSASTEDLVNVASAVGNKIRGSSKQAYSDWLAASVGQLSVHDVTLAKALEKLRLPILTTNYDDLVERALGIPSSTWVDKDELKQIFSSEIRAVGHLHGIWNKPDSVILTESDYTRLTSDPASQMLQRSFYESTSFIYVGFGGGLEDPNFDRLLQMHGELFPESRSSHFRLCRASELETLQRKHINSDIIPIAYGKGHDDLTPFLEGLASNVSQTGRSQGESTDFARRAVLDSIRSNYLLARQLPDFESRGLHELMVPPVILSVPHSQSAAARAAIKDTLEPIRLDPTELMQQPKILIIAGDELSGMSTALQWLLSTASGIHDAAPIFIDARQPRSPKHPIDGLVRATAVNLRLIDQADDPLPHHVLAIDNLKHGSSRINRSMIADINASEAKFILIGCREGDESSLLQQLDHSSLVAEIAYMGKFGKAEISDLANFVSEKQGPVIADTVLENLRKHSLQRTPLNICLLISLSLDGETIGADSSDTSILNQYVQKLIGWDGPYADARMTLSPQNREAVLSQMARRMTQAKAGSVSYSTALEYVSEYIEAVGWAERPRETLDRLIETRILRVSEADQVSFRQTSYLHLYSAKAAVADVDGYYGSLLDRPLYYAPIIRHFAALVRGSEKTLQKIYDLMLLEAIRPPKSQVFEKISLTAAPPHSEETDGADAGSAEEEQEEQDSSEFYDDSSDDDILPFPLDDENDRPEWISRSALVDLASRVLRDSDEVQQPALKDEVFLLAIKLWGQVLDDLNANGVFDNAADFTADAMRESGFLEDDSLDETKRVLKLVIPTFVVVAGLNTCLVSVKLLRNWERVQKRPGFHADTYSSVISTIFALSLSSTGFTSNLSQLTNLHGDKWISGSILAVLAEQAYMRQTLDVKEESDLRRFVVDMAGRRHSFKSSNEKARWLDNLDRRLQTRRLIEQRNALPRGETVLAQVSSKSSEEI